MKPDLAAHVAEKQAAQKKAHDGGRKGRELVVGESVIARNYSDGEKWFARIKGGVPGRASSFFYIFLSGKVGRPTSGEER